MVALHQQVVNYTIQSSMFDLVLVGLFRFLVNCLLYGAADVSHWLPVGVTTASTSAFAGAKVFLYQWSKFGPMTFDVMLLLTSFVLAWGELWFLDVRVLPLEYRARELVSHFEDPERAPLLAGRGAAVNAPSQRSSSNQHGKLTWPFVLFTRRNELIRRYVEGSSVWGESVANFYSPLESPEDSGDEVEQETLVTIPRKFKRKTPLNQIVSFFKFKESFKLLTGISLKNPVHF